MSSYQVVVETPRDSREKYAFDPGFNGFTLRKLLPLGMSFPFDFGFIPGTKGEDGDPIDALLISEFKTFPGCRMDCRLVGLLEATQQEKGRTIRNDRYFFIPDSSTLYAHINSVHDLPSKLLDELLFFFIAYNKEEGKIFEPIGLEDADHASAMLNKLLHYQEIK
jgi:inorganic pyrophosphatase